MIYTETRTGQANVPKLQSSRWRVISEAKDITQTLIITTSSHLPTAVCVTQKSKNMLQQMSDSPSRKRLQYPWDTSNSKIASSPMILQRLKILAAFELKQEGKK